MLVSVAVNYVDVFAYDGGLSRLWAGDRAH